jgi:hypothetical protein
VRMLVMVHMMIVIGGAMFIDAIIDALRLRRRIGAIAADEERGISVLNFVLALVAPVARQPDHREARDTLAHEVRHLIAQMARQNFLWGAPRIHGELLMLGFSISQATGPGSG